MNSLQIIDSHTGGEPTRVVVSGLPELNGNSLQEKITYLRENHDWIRTALVTEPRGSEIIVGALLLPPKNPAAVASVIFFNNVDYLGMCGHGTIGLFATLAHLGKISVGQYLLETSVGEVSVSYHADRKVSFENVASHRYRENVSVQVPKLGEIYGDIAWGGNWFFLVKQHQEIIEAANVERLTQVTKKIYQALIDQKITGKNGGLIDHIELFSDQVDLSIADSKNFVLCPGGQYDRSPCGTGTSAKVACLVADGKLEPGQTWRQQSITGSIFEASYRIRNGEIFPLITGQAFVNGELTAIFDPEDPLKYGVQ